jgi:pilus assembly protein Flp/PilA
MLEALQLHLLQLINRFRQDERGAALVEYGLLIGLIAAVCVAGITVLGGGISTLFTNLGNWMTAIAATIPA